ncbi:CENP-A-nucleosome distal centromere subunit CENP-L [Penicillium chermesinum]|uniref:CENP-A-nucleosome distal centromere subunit CENP-L n=1 Tax=Penicillium chermesinum TaxID=63820 RepID=A0A9W9PBD0_9EURO|nr:CENP-A-nucleosome distal centromere subunit CENP-L [Penicillium chermesinum]KAJ5240103.1 CENP-A-nucleosome distal centromere subunit CENP-L [Penicillium chermesinum]KAJ6166979.1 CENP-A-nucleosome distal centromere subunit CENP-L [Penicillium chermesinum]
MEQPSPWELFNSSWTLHRLSPLHHQRDYVTLLDNPAALKVYATRLRDQLTGDVLAGLQGNAIEDDSLSKTGALTECTWQAISTSPTNRSSDRASSFPGILVTLQYENITYRAAILADPESDTISPRKGSTFLPLLLTKLPNTLRQTFISFLSANFDAYCASLRLPSSFLCKGLETYIDELSASRPRSDNIVEEVVKDLQLTLAFSTSIAPALRTLNIGIARASLANFLRNEPQKSKQKQKQPQRNPLLENLTAYLDTHLAMQLDLDGSSQNLVARQHVRLSKVACAAFVLGTDGKMKLVVDTTDADAAEDLSTRDQATLHASEALLRAVIRKAVIGDQAKT